MKKRLVALLLTLALCLSLGLVTAGAQNPEEGLYRDADYTQPLTLTDGKYEGTYIPSNANEMFYYYSESPCNARRTGGNMNDVIFDDESGHKFHISGFGPDGGDLSATIEITSADGSQTKTIEIHLTVAAEVAAHPVSAADQLPEQYDSETEQLGPAPFTYGGQTYYLGVQFLPMWEQNSTGVHLGGLSHRETYEGHYRSSRIARLGFWTKGVSGYTAVDADTAAELAGQFTKLSLGVYAHPDDAIKTYPQLVTSESTYPCTRQYLFTEQNKGRYFIIAEGTIGNQTVASVNLQGMRLVENVPVTGDTIEEINAELQRLADEGSTDPNFDRDNIYVVRLKKGAYGSETDPVTLVIPEGLASEVDVEGRLENNQPVTTFYGGMENNGVGVVRNVNFISTEEPDRTMDWEELENTANCAIYGAGRTQYDRCTFTGYTVAVKSVGGFCFGGDKVTFTDNHVAYYINSDFPGGGNIWMNHFTFQENDVAVWIRHIPEGDLLPWMYEIKNSRFVNNTFDFINQTDGQWFFFPKNFFLHTFIPVQTFAARTGEESHAPALEGGSVSCYPVATDDSFNTFAYGESGAISNDRTYAIPVSELNAQEFVAIENNAPVAAYTFDLTQEAPELMTLAASETQTAPATFDPTVRVERSGKTITVTMDEMPEGKSAKVFVPCAWTDVAVLEGETVIESAADGTMVSFQAVEGGTYTIRNAAPVFASYAEGDPADGDLVIDVFVEQPEELKDAVLICAAYDETARMIVVSVREDGISAQQSIALDCRVDEAKEVKVFLLDRANGYQPVCKAASCSPPRP